MEFIESIIHAHPIAQEQLQPLIEFSRKKLWHQLTDSLEKAIQLPIFKEGDNLFKLYASFIKPIDGKLNPLRLAHILVQVSQTLPADGAAQFLEDSIKGLKDKEARVVVQAEQGVLLLRSNKVAEAKQLVESARSELDSIAMADPTVHSAFYKTAIEFYKRMGPASEYYRSGMSYLAYTPLEQLSHEEQAKLAFELALAAMLGDDVYTFGDLIQNPVFGSLEKAGHKWLSEMLLAFNRGDIAAFEAVRASADSLFRAIPTLVTGEPLVRQKLIILSLMDLVFARPAAERTLTFAEIAQRTRLELDEVEFCVMRALARGLLRGSIDEVARTVTVTWVQPRVLDTTQIESMRRRLQDWGQGVQRVVDLLSSETRELTA